MSAIDELRDRAERSLGMALPSQCEDCAEMEIELRHAREEREAAEARAKAAEERAQELEKALAECSSETLMREPNEDEMRPWRAK